MSAQTELAKRLRDKSNEWDAGGRPLYICEEAAEMLERSCEGCQHITLEGPWQGKPCCECTLLPCEFVGFICGRWTPKEGA